MSSLSPKAGKRKERRRAMQSHGFEPHLECLEPRLVLSDTASVIYGPVPGFVSEEVTREVVQENLYPTINEGTPGVGATTHFSVPEVEPNDGVLGYQILSLAAPDPGTTNSLTVYGELVDASDTDVFLLELTAGDVLGGALCAAPSSAMDPVIELYSPNGVLLYRNDNDNGANILLPPESPLPRVDPDTPSDSFLNYVIPEDGMYIVRVDHSDNDDDDIGEYEMTLTVSRPGIEDTPVGTQQILFIDFDGETIPEETFGTEYTFTALSYALTGWGLTAADEDDVIDAIIATIEENYSELGLTGNNGDYNTDAIAGNYSILILNSRDHVDEFGNNPMVSRVVVGLSDQYSPGAAGLAQYIDPGNFSTDDTAWVDLTDLAGLGTTSVFDLNQIPLQPGVSIVDLIGVAVGNIITHEAGHFLGSWHTNPFNSIYNLMDSGAGGLPNIIGIGPDYLFGSADDTDVDFVVDEYYRSEGVGASGSYLAYEDCTNVTAFAGATGTIFPLVREDTDGNWEPIDNAIIAIDVSSSMYDTRGQDTNGDQKIDDDDDVNGDGVPGSLIDLALATILDVQAQGYLPDNVSIDHHLRAGRCRFGNVRGNQHANDRCECR